MDSEKLKEIRNNIAVLPVLRERLRNCVPVSVKPNVRLKPYWRSIEKSALMLSSLKTTLSRFLLKIVGKYQESLKRGAGNISCKIEYDRTCQQAEEFKRAS